MAMKRKFEVDSEDASPMNFKQQKLIPFPQYGSDDNLDCMMTEAEPFYAHTRISSNVSTTSSDASTLTPPTTPPYVYPTLDIYPSQDAAMNLDVPQNPPSPVGLMQPSGSFQHHGSHCSQIPKLRVSCSPGLNGQRTMWSFCEQCGAISMVHQE